MSALTFLVAASNFMIPQSISTGLGYIIGLERVKDQYLLPYPFQNFDLFFIAEYKFIKESEIFLNIQREVGGERKKRREEIFLYCTTI